MKRPAVEQLADALLYEGYLLYPYRRSALKNQYRWNFGVLFPPAYCRQPAGAERSWLQTECLLRDQASSKVTVTVRFLSLSERKPASADGLADDGWQEETARAIVRSAELGELPTGGHWSEEVGQPPLRVAIRLAASSLDSAHWRLTVRIDNETVLNAAATISRSDALLQSLVATHVIITVEPGSFISLLDPPAALREAAAGCRNLGAWPALVGEPGQCDTVLAASIILPDYPRIAEESPGNHFDGCEMDEMLSLRIRTLTDAEKTAMQAAGAPARQLLDQAESLESPQLSRLHGALREVLRAGDRVRLHPRGRADIFDLALAGKTAMIQAVEQDFEGRIHLAVIVDDDPGRDLGAQGMPGHRFFFSPDEVTRLEAAGQEDWPCGRSS
ncbi:MAG: hypothetical protein JNM56_14015 [Planctomycetia bacterium]|nr:hypothetical protein [Planctomycetia bacterium]